MIKFRSAMLLLLAFAPSAFAAAVDALPYAEYASVPTALFVFSFLVMARFIFFSEKNRKYRILFLTLVLFLAIGLIVLPIILARTELLETLEEILASAFFPLVSLGIIATIISLIIGFVLIYKKDKFIIKSALSILAIEIVIVILIIKYNIINSGAVFLAALSLAALNGILGIVSIIRLLISLRNKKKT